MIFLLSKARLKKHLCTGPRKLFPKTLQAGIPGDGGVDRGAENNQEVALLFISASPIRSGLGIICFPFMCANLNFSLRLSLRFI